VLSTAHDVSREWRFISALASTAVPVPRPVVYCADAAITGAKFYVMGLVEGLVLADRDAGLATAPQARARAAEHLVDVLVALHALDPVVIGLGDMVRQVGYLERQLRRWRAQVHATGAPELALLDEVHDLLAHRILAQASGIVHGDYRANGESTQTGSERRRAMPCDDPHAARWHLRRHQATFRGGRNAPYKRGVTGSNPVAPTSQNVWLDRLKTAADHQG
jgi:hypothetical protein